jgi:undecaprenyl-diphosphatase
MLAALVLGFRRDAAARFSFLLSIPAIAGAGLFELKHLMHGTDGAAPLAIGLVVSAVTGYLSIAWLLRFLRARTTMPFVVYRIALGILLLGLLATHHLAP